MPILHWLTRDEDTRAVQGVPYRLLQEDPSHSFGDPDSTNMLIQGDNLEALKALASGVVTVYPPEGGWNVLLRFPDVIDEEDLVVRLIQEERVTVQPGFFFDMRVPGFVSLSLLLEPDAFANAARRILQVIEEVSL